MIRKDFIFQKMSPLRSTFYTKGERSWLLWQYSAPQMAGLEGSKKLHILLKSNVSDSSLLRFLASGVPYPCVFLGQPLWRMLWGAASPLPRIYSMSVALLLGFVISINLHLYIYEKGTKMNSFQETHLIKSLEDTRPLWELLICIVLCIA